MSRESFKLNPNLDPAADRMGYPSDHEIAVTRAAIENFGECAPKAVAFCGLDAWFESRDAEVRQWSRIFNRLKN